MFIWKKEVDDGTPTNPEKPSNPSKPSNPGNTDKNPGTSDLPIYIVWAIGIGALGYAVYYFNKYYSTSKDEI